MKVVPGMRIWDVVTGTEWTVTDDRRALCVKQGKGDYGPWRVNSTYNILQDTSDWLDPALKFEDPFISWTRTVRTRTAKKP